VEVRERLADGWGQVRRAEIKSSDTLTG